MRVCLSVFWMHLGRLLLLPSTAAECPPSSDMPASDDSRGEGRRDWRLGSPEGGTRRSVRSVGVKSGEQCLSCMRGGLTAVYRASRVTIGIPTEFGLSVMRGIVQSARFARLGLRVGRAFNFPRPLTFPPVAEFGNQRFRVWPLRPDLVRRSTSCASMTASMYL